LPLVIGFIYSLHLLDIRHLPAHASDYYPILLNTSNSPSL
jgi:hypothetical protein